MRQATPFALASSRRRLSGSVLIRRTLCRDTCPLQASRPDSAIDRDPDSVAQDDRHPLDAVHEAAVHELDLPGGLPARATGEELLEQDARLETGEARAEAEVLAEAEGDVRLDGASQVEPIGVLAPH